FRASSTLHWGSGSVVVLRTWCLITSDENWRVCKTRSVWGLDYGYRVTWDHYISQGDPAIVYVNKKGFAAVVEVGEKFYDENPIGWSKVYPYRFRITIKREVGPIRLPTWFGHPSPILGRPFLTIRTRSVKLVSSTAK